MNCLESRRLLLASPRDRSAELQSHVDECAQCGQYAAHLMRLDENVHGAAAVAVPDALADRILLRRRFSPLHYGRHALAALVLLSAGAMIALSMDWGFPTRPVSAVALGPSHPAVEAIELVADQEPSFIDESSAADPAVFYQGLDRLGLSVRKDEVSVRYAGKCLITEHGDCEHVALETPHGPVSIILLPHHFTRHRVLVADRRMTAALHPAPSGTYIVVASSERLLKRAEKLFFPS